MSLITFRLKFVANVVTPGTPAQVRQALVTSGLRGKAENKIAALAAGDSQTGVPAFDWQLGVNATPVGVEIYPKLIITVDTTRSFDQLLNAIDDYFDEMKAHIRALALSFPSTSITGWHVHRGNGFGGHSDEAEM